MEKQLSKMSGRAAVPLRLKILLCRHAFEKSERVSACFVRNDAGGVGRQGKFALKRVARMGGRKPTFLLGRWRAVDTGIAWGVFGWIWKKFGKPPSAWRGRKGWKYMMLSGR